MPTPFYAPNFAKELHHYPVVSRDDQAVLGNCLAKYPFDHITTNVQAISDLRRQLSSFFTIFLLPDTWTPWDRSLDQHPEVIPARLFADPHAAYLAG